MRRTVPALLAFLLLLGLVGEALAASVFFDDFTDPAGAGWSWSLGANGTGQKYVDFAYNGTLLYLHDSGSNPEFALVGRNDAFDGINAYWRLSLRFRFQGITAYGTNIASGTALFDPNSRQPQSQPVRTDWQDVLLIHQYSGAFYIDAFGAQHYNVPGAGDTNWHTLELEVADGSYVLRLDGSQIGSGSTGGIVPRSLWFGNYFTQDWWGNFTDIQVDWVRVETDREPPTTTATPSGTAGNNGWWLSDVQVSLSAADAWSGVAVTEYRIDGGLWQVYHGPFTVSGDGVHTVECRSTDNAGNAEAVGSLPVRIDTVPPGTTATLSGTSGSNGWYVSGVQVDLFAADGTSGVAATYYRVDGGPWQTYTGPFVVSSDGDHTVEYYAVDAAGNQEAAKSTRVPIDTTPPATTATPSGTAGNNGWWRSDVQVSLSAADGTSGVDGTEYRIDSGTWQAYSGPFTVSGDGDHTVEYRSTDAAGNVESVRSLEVRIDTVPPASTITGPSDGDWIHGTVTVDGTASDGTSGVASVAWSNDGGSTWQAASGTTSWSAAWDTTAGPDGDYRVCSRADDEAGNRESPTCITVHVDNTPPSTSATPSGTAGNNGWWQSGVQVTLSADDGSGIGVASTAYRIDGGAWQTYSGPFVVTGDGSHTVEYRSTDGLGNAEAVRSLEVRIDTAPPSTTAAPSGTVGANGWYVSGVQVDLSASDATSGVDVTEYRIDGGSWHVYSGPFTVSGDGSHTVEYRSTDAAGNVEPVQTLDLRIDTTPPSTTASPSGAAGNGGWWLSDVEVTLSASDATSGVDGTEYRLDGGAWQAYTGPFTISRDGTHTVEYRSTDAAGNQEAIRTLTVQIDTTPPATTASPSGTPGNNGWYRSDVQVSLSAADATSGVDGTAYRIDGGAWQTYSGPFTVGGDGTHVVEYRSTDNAGNTETMGSLTVRIDTTPPATTVSTSGTAGEGSWWLSDVQVSLSASDGASGVDVTMYRLDGGTWQAYSGPFTVAGDGVHTVEYRSSDVAGNTEAVGSLTVRIDTVPPATTASPTGTAGDNGWWLSDVQIALSASDATSGVGATRYRVDGGGWTDYTGPFTVSGDGTHTIAYRSTDTAGNIEADRLLTVRIDTTPPSTSAATDGLAGNDGWYRSPVTVTLSAADATSGVEETSYRVDGGGWLTYTTPVVVTSEGEHTVVYRSTDNAGNVETEGELAFRVDTVPPQTTANLDGPVGMNGWYTGGVTLTLSASDGTSGVEAVLLDGEVVTGPVAYADEGVYEVAYHALDRAGNEEEHTLAFGLDLTPPEAEVVGGAFCPGCGEVLLIQPRASDATSGVGTWRLEVLDGGRVVRSWSGTGGPTSIPWDGRDGSGNRVDVGTYDLHLWVQDEAGWTAEAAGRVQVTPVPPPPPTPVPPTATPPLTPTPTPTPTRVWTPTPTATPRPGETPTPPPPTPTLVPPTPTPISVAVAAPEPEPEVVLVVSVFEDTNADGYRQPEERGLAGLRVEVAGEGGVQVFYPDPLGLVAVRLPGPGVYRFVLADRPGVGWKPTTRTALEVRVGADGSVALLPVEGERASLPVGLAEGAAFAFGLAPHRVGLLIPLGAAALLFAAVLAGVLDRRARAIRGLERALTYDV